VRLSDLGYWMITAADADRVLLLALSDYFTPA
jgi:hypothetical protein